MKREDQRWHNLARLICHAAAAAARAPLHLVLHGSQHNPPLIFLGLLFVLLLVTVHICLLVLFLFVVFQNPDPAEHSNHLLLLWLSSLEQQPARSSSIIIKNTTRCLPRCLPSLHPSSSPSEKTSCVMYVLLAEKPVDTEAEEALRPEAEVGREARRGVEEDRRRRRRTKP